MVCSELIVLSAVNESFSIIVRSKSEAPVRIAVTNYLAKYIERFIAREVSFVEGKERESSAKSTF